MPCNHGVEESMTLTFYEKCRKIRLLKQFTILILAISAFYAAVCTPVLIWAQSDILIADSVFLTVWDVVMTMVNYAFYWVSFAYILYAISKFTLGNCKSFLGFYFVASLFRYAANLLAACVMDGFSMLYWSDLFNILLYVGLDAVQMGVVVLLVWLCVKNRQERAMLAHRRALAEDPNAPLKMPQWLPFTSLFDLKKNELVRAAFLTSTVPAVIHIASRIRYDIFIGAPASVADTVWMIVYYLSDVAAWLIGYLLIVFLLNQLHAFEEKKKA